MNRLLLEAHELDGEGVATIGGRRAMHLLEVLGAAPGRVVRAGVLDGARGEASVTRILADGSIEVACEFEDHVPPRSDDTLVLGLPRPKVLARVLEHAAALGFGRIAVVRTWRTDKSHLRSRVLEAGRTRAHLVAGLEQGGRTRLPEVVRVDRFKPFAEDQLDGFAPPARFVADVASARDLDAITIEPGAPFALAIGPERGFTPFEVDVLVARGFLPVRLLDGVLRVETAVAFACGQLAALRGSVAR